MSIDLYSSINGDNKIDLLILEAMIHDNPVQFVKEIQERTPDTTIVICTALHEDKLHNEFRELGIQNILTKPVDPSTLRSTVRKVVSKNPIKRIIPTPNATKVIAIFDKLRFYYARLRTLGFLISHHMVGLWLLYERIFKI